MKRIFLSIIVAALALGCANEAYAQSTGGTVLEDQTLNSQYLKMERLYSIYLPPDYGTSTRSYPVLYLLHGAGDNHTSWIQFGEVKAVADKAIAEGTATPMIIVMPDAHEGYFNELADSWHGEDYFIKELIPHIEKTYRVRTGRQYRAVSGLSMGGGGAIGYALRHPDMFIASCPLSAAPGPRDYKEFIERAYRRIGKEKIDALPQSVLDASYVETNLIEKFNSLEGEQLEAVKKVRWYFDCGDDDHLSIRLNGMREAISKKGIAHEYRMRDGSHNWLYWRTSLPDVLTFISAAFRKQ